ncbi:MAG: hypothetical protein AVDCRST_MAG30-2088 [uncultured Solirubrobacteraceae bacterium]|uniref:Uncharacterized protein n=1 Tax=uncultured Solirubrobacteraceae bacterium TaxID=1162706 RepID=A0A6J4SSE5_9ACTN|nr:MAG: hypothetical protein AVDCRST_MAG30-2088 [uncultured Solirubrobacteraceae bacterium]
MQHHAPRADRRLGGPAAPAHGRDRRGTVTVKLDVQIVLRVPADRGRVGESRLDATLSAR